MDNITAWKYVQQYFRDYIPTTKAQKVFYEEMNPKTMKKLCMQTNVSVIKGDTLEVASTFYEPLVLILADAHVPGGCVGAGAGMQEESLFRRSALHKHLLPSLYPIEDDAAIYASHVQMLAGGYMDFIACPGIKMPVITDDNRLMPEDEVALRKKIHVILQTAYKNGHTALVLGALGCGVWGCPPRHVAEVFKSVIEEYNGVFTNITFAILGANYNFFRDVLNVKGSG
jgi:uncharacterized protein (TIGR02452 family)